MNSLLMDSSGFDWKNNNVLFTIRHSEKPFGKFCRKKAIGSYKNLKDAE